MSTATPFKTPRRLLIPKLVRSRDAWKAKANARKDQRKALEIRVRDLEASREHHRLHAEQLRIQVQQLQLENQQLQRQLDSARTVAAAVAPPTDAPPKSTGPAADTTPPASSTSR